MTAKTLPSITSKVTFVSLRTDITLRTNQATASNSDDEEMSADDDEDGDYSLNLIKSLMVLLDCKEAMASGDGEHLALIQKQMLLYFSSVSGFNSHAFEMLISTIQNAVLLFPTEAHQCKWAALANWQKQKHRN